MAVRALLIDDDARLFDLLEKYLAPNDVEVSHAPDGARGLAALRGGGFDVVLLDIMMPGMDGLRVLERMRSQDLGVPVIMLTARGDEADRVVGLELGADDYVAKPFSPRELLARIRAVLRRANARVGARWLSAGGIVCEPDQRRAMVEGEVVDLTAIEFDLLAALIRRPGQVTSRAALLEEAGRGDVIVGERTVDVHIFRLRKKLGAHGDRIKTVRGVGYVMAGERG